MSDGDYDFMTCDIQTCENTAIEPVPAGRQMCKSCYQAFCYGKRIAKDLKEKDAEGDAHE